VRVDDALAELGPVVAAVEELRDRVEGRADRAEGVASAGTAARAWTIASWRISPPWNSTSRLSLKWRKKVRSVRPARSAISATVVWS
jgi:hypothetical protein